MFSKEELADIQKLPIGHPKWDPQNVNRRFRQPSCHLPANSDDHLAPLRSQVQAEGTRMNELHRRFEKADTALTLLESAAKFSAVKEGGSLTSRGDKSLDARRKIGENRRNEFGHPSEESLCLVETGLNTFRRPQPVTRAATRAALSSSDEDFTNLKEWFPVIYFRKKKKYRVTLMDQLKSMNIKLPQLVNTGGDTGRIIEEYGERDADLLKEIPSNISHQYRNERALDFLGDPATTPSTETLLSVRKSQQDKQTRREASQATKSEASCAKDAAQSADLITSLSSSRYWRSTMKSEYNNQFEHPNYLAAPATHRKRSDTFVGWREALWDWDKKWKAMTTARQEAEQRKNAHWLIVTWFPWRYPTFQFPVY